MNTNEMRNPINPTNPNHIYLADEAFDMLARAGVQASRINEMRANRDAVTWSDNQKEATK
jgi:hypothetical protein